MTDVTQHPAIIRWREGASVSEQFQVLDNTLYSFFFPTADAPVLPILFQGAINKGGDFAAPIVDELSAPILLFPAPDTWTTLNLSAWIIAPFGYLYLFADTGPTADYEVRLVSKRGGTGGAAAAGGGP